MNIDEFKQYEKSVTEFHKLLAEVQDADLPMVWRNLNYKLEELVFELKKYQILNAGKT